MERYSRERCLPQIGIRGREEIEQARVLCVGSGALAHPAMTYLVATGIAKLGLVDDDKVELSNLHRQVLFTDKDIGNSKVAVAARKLAEFSCRTDVVPYATRLKASNAVSLMTGYDIVLDCTDNFSTKFVINDAAVMLGLPVVHAAIDQFQGVVASFWASKGPCYRCYLNEIPKAKIQNCAESGVLGSIAGVLGSLQATEAIKLIVTKDAQVHHPISINFGTMSVIELDTMTFSRVRIPKKSNCPTCSIATDQIVLRDSVAEMACTLQRSVEAIDFLSTRNTFRVIVDVREPEEFREAHIDGAINIPLSSISRGKISLSVSKDPILIYCASGVRSSHAIDHLSKAGFSNCIQLRGGFESLAAEIKS